MADGRVHAAVVRGATAEELAQVIVEVAQGSAARRVAAANEELPVPEGVEADADADAADDSNAVPTETPIKAAHRCRDKDQIRVLLLAGACAQGVHEDVTAVSLCVVYDLPTTLRALLESGAADAQEDVPLYDQRAFGREQWDADWSPLHLCITPPSLGPGWDTSPRLECMRVLAQHGANVDEPSHWDPPVVWAAMSGNSAAIRVLVAELGADVDGRGFEDLTALYHAVSKRDVAMAQMLLSLGASTTGFADDPGFTALMRAVKPGFGVPFSVEMAQLILAHTPDEGRRVVKSRDGGKSALDYLFDDLPVGNVGPGAPPFLSPERAALVRQLNASAVPFLPATMARVLAHMNHVDAELVLAGLAPGDLFPEEQMVAMGMELQGLRAVEERVAALEARERELKAKLRARGMSTDTEEEDDEDGEEKNKDDEQMGEAEGEKGEGEEEEEGDDDGSAGAAASGGGGEGEDEDEETDPSAVAASGGARD